MLGRAVPRPRAGQARLERAAGPVFLGALCALALRDPQGDMQMVQSEPELSLPLLPPPQHLCSPGIWGSPWGVGGTCPCSAPVTQVQLPGLVWGREAFGQVPRASGRPLLFQKEEGSAASGARSLHPACLWPDAPPCDL